MYGCLIQTVKLFLITGLREVLKNSKTRDIGQEGGKGSGKNQNFYVRKKVKFS